CPGYRLIFPPGLQPHTSYPFGLHTVMSFPWDYSVCRDGFFLTSHLCTGEIKGNGRCMACNDLGKNEHIRKIVSRYTDGIHENTPLLFHGIGGLIDVAHCKTAVVDQFRLVRLNDMKKLFLKQGVIEVHKQMLL
ncbi:hypothetical protein BC826DRAFT_894607, partial [Russula brevipes]